MVNITINKKKISVPEGISILQACELGGIQIPRFCYHEKLSIAGNCRMCLVHLDKSLKPVASCAMTVMDGMSIFTDSSVVKKAREGVMEFLLANHPLDCPICDQGGECDLQDQALVFGNDRGRFYEMKRSVSDKNCGPLIKTVMTRCIHCTRCVRFSDELSGLRELGTTGRGHSTEIGNYVGKNIVSEVSGNLIDLCPVGALTSKPYAFTARSWELKRVETIDTLDGMCSNISVHVAGRRIMRILPVLHEGINEEWINDKTRFSYDGVFSQRLLTPYRKTKENQLEEISWKIALCSLLYQFSNLKKGGKSFVLGSELDLESTYSLVSLSNVLVNSTLSYQDILTRVNVDFRANYLFNENFSNLENLDSIALVGVDLNKEMPVLLMRLRKIQRIRDLFVCTFGLASHYSLSMYRVGNSIDTFLSFIEGKHRACGPFINAKKSGLIFGSSFLEHHAHSIMSVSLQKLGIVQKGKMSLNYLHNGAGKVGAFELGINGEISNKKGSHLFLNANEVQNKSVKETTYFSTHGVEKIQNSTLALPSLTNFEKESLFFNVEGRGQHSKKILTPSGSTRIDYKILNSWLDICQNKHKISENLVDIRSSIESYTPFLYNSVGFQTFSLVLSNQVGFVSRGLWGNSIDSFYQTSSLTFASKTMTECVKNKKIMRSYV